MPKATKAELETATSHACIDRDIEAWEEGYNTPVGERGVKLSAGQRQRISLARAFLRDPKILIFDEPTSALDVESQQAIKKSLQSLAKDRIIFIVTHRMSMLDIASRIFDLKDGNITERKS